MDVILLSDVCVCERERGREGRRKDMSIFCSNNIVHVCDRIGCVLMESLMYVVLY